MNLSFLLYTAGLMTTCPRPDVHHWFKSSWGSVDVFGAHFFQCWGIQHCLCCFHCFVTLCLLQHRGNRTKIWCRFVVLLVTEYHESVRGMLYFLYDFNVSCQFFSSVGILVGWCCAAIANLLYQTQTRKVYQGAPCLVVEISRLQVAVRFVCISLKYVCWV